MNKQILKLLTIVTNHINFSLDTTDLRIYHKPYNNSSYSRIRDIVSITEELHEVGINHQVHDNYIQTYNIA